MGSARAHSVWFVETRHFTKEWTDLNLTVEDLMDLQDLLKDDPTIYPVVPGTGGLRKMRFAPRAGGKGKRGGYRICYAFIPRFSSIVLIFVYPKNKKDNLNTSEKKNVKELLKQLEQEFESRLQS